MSISFYPLPTSAAADLDGLVAPRHPHFPNSRQMLGVGRGPWIDRLIDVKIASFFHCPRHEGPNSEGWISHWRQANAFHSKVEVYPVGSHVDSIAVLDNIDRYGLSFAPPDSRFVKRLCLLWLCCCLEPSRKPHDSLLDQCLEPVAFRRRYADRLDVVCWITSRQQREVLTGSAPVGSRGLCRRANTQAQFWRRPRPRGDKEVGDGAD